MGTALHDVTILFDRLLKMKTATVAMKFRSIHLPPNIQ
jgi:hypothetical protein